MNILLDSGPIIGIIRSDNNYTATFGNTARRTGGGVIKFPKLTSALNGMRDRLHVPATAPQSISAQLGWVGTRVGNGEVESQ
jgi:hypothetical protein